MIRRVDYRIATNLLVFTALWFAIGAIVLWSPIPGALGVDDGMFAAWLILFFMLMAAGGASLTLAAVNAAFPPGGQPEPAATARDTTHAAPTATAPQPAQPVSVPQPLWARDETDAAGAPAPPQPPRLVQPPQRET